MESTNLSDVECPICLFILINPLKTPCTHSFCSHCIQELFELSVSGSILCPICRNNLSNMNIMVNDVGKSNLIQNNFAEMLEIRKKDINSYLLKFVSVNFLFGNTHKNISTSDSNTHEWTFFLKIENGNTQDYIEKIVVTLHPTFPKPIIKLEEEPFEFTRIGWGVFDIPSRIYWKKWTGLEPSEITHFLSFQQNGSQNKFGVKIDRKKFEENNNK